ncbi:MAG: hypothetical protein KatS3mg105_4519 [Gemmatales bacterium]|nr:MAG: hypothetical protein KatS3mg105_4519 [Gemmatales bacterium]
MRPWPNMVDEPKPFNLFVVCFLERATTRVPLSARWDVKGIAVKILGCFAQFICTVN